MFRPLAMTEVELIIPEKDLLAVTNVLARQGIFHQADASYLKSDEGISAAESWQDKATAYGDLERRIVATMHVLGLEEGLPSPTDQIAQIEIEAARPVVQQIEQEVQKTSDQLASEQKDLDQLETSLHQLEPIAGIDFSLSTLRQPRYMFFMLGIIPIHNLERLQTSLARIPFVLLTLRQDSQKAVVWLAGARRNADVLDRAARSAYLNPIDLPDIHQGTPLEIIQSLRKDIQNANQRIADQKMLLTKLRDAYQQQIQTLLWRVRVGRMLADAIAHFGRLRYTYLLVGWVPSSGLARFTQQLQKTSSNIFIETNPSQRSDIAQNAPVALPSSGIAGVFQQLVTTYALPRYGEVDPTWLTVLTFPLLFGAMFGDVGQGLVLALLGGVMASGRVKMLRGLSSLGGIVIACGLAATLFGILYGSLFGLDNVLPALWIRPINNIVQILGITIGAGVVVLSLGFLIAIINAWTARDWGQLFFAHNTVAGLVLYWSLIGLIASAAVNGFPIPPVVFVIAAIVSGLGVLFSEMLRRLLNGQRPLLEDGPGLFMIQAGFELLEVIVSFLSNTLSFVRVGAFAVAHGGLSAMVFILANLLSPSQGVGYWIVLVVGNLFIVGFEGLIVGIQTMRLEYYEFFSKFFTGGGMRYRPLTVLPARDR
jgi:V/A-type H+/Na+-transporting ATPase subunit I